MKRVIFSLVLIVSFLMFSLDSNGSDPITLTFQSVGSSEQITATLIKPEGGGPFPAVVIMHDCSGLGSRSSGASTESSQTRQARSSSGALDSKTT